MKLYMKIFITLLCLVIPYVSFADCPVNCLLLPGTICVNNSCVPLVKTTPTPTPISTPCDVIGCLLSGGKCVNNVCVKPTPTPTPTPTSTPKPIVTEIKINAESTNNIVAKTLDCSNMDLKNLHIYLVRKVPPPTAYYFSSIFTFYYDAQKNTKISYFFVRKDLMNKYVFVPLDPTIEPPKAQFYGIDFSFNLWENTAFKDFISSKTCEELKNGGFYFGYGISIKGDRSDYEGAIFTFR